MPKYLVSIVNWNSTAATNECLAGLAQLPSDRQPDVVVVDNHSTHEKFEIMSATREKLRSIRVIMNDTNLGFAGGHNPNIKLAKEKGYDYICLLNPDTEVIDKNMFDKLAKALDSNPKALAAAPTILKRLDPDIIWFGGGRMSLKTSHVSHLQVGQMESLPGGAEKTEFLTGCCIVIDLKKADLSQLLLPEEYFLYWEDADWCSKLKKAGFELLYVPEARLLHHVSHTLGERSPAYIYYNIRNHFLFVRRNIPPAYRPLSWLRIILITIKYHGVILLRYESGRTTALKALWWAWLDGLKDKTGILTRNL
ncbi:MAG TPA: glycosyltransferase family 2 protein [Candidatus Saccharimonadales bacterium]|nr:glycosyltransferase family 2 protein [Candidatus Saccharimonadales bacterium]